MQKALLITKNDTVYIAVPHSVYQYFVDNSLPIYKYLHKINWQYYIDINDLSKPDLQSILSCINIPI